jgi:hypothetical protein
MVNPGGQATCGQCGLDLRKTRAPQPKPSGSGWTHTSSGIPPHTLAFAALAALVAVGLTALAGPVAGVCAIPVSGIVAYRMSHR